MRIEEGRKRKLGRGRWEGGAGSGRKGRFTGEKNFLEERVAQKLAHMIASAASRFRIPASCHIFYIKYGI